VAALLALLISNQPAFAQYAAAVGAYNVPDDGVCRSTEWLGSVTEDALIGSVCIPTHVIGTVDTTMITLAMAELISPEMLQIMLARQAMGELSLPEVYEVEVDDDDGDVYDLTDGTVVRATENKYVGYIGYREAAVLYRNGSDWHLCVSGANFEVEILREAQRSYGRRAISASLRDIEAMDACR
jgi:hypothetical protein